MHGTVPVYATVGVFNDRQLNYLREMGPAVVGLEESETCRVLRKGQNFQEKLMSVLRSRQSGNRILPPPGNGSLKTV